MKGLHKLAYVLLIIGGLNWGLTGLGWNVVNMVLGSLPTVENLVYILVGLSAIVEIVTHKKTCKMCGTGSMSSGASM